MARSGMQTMAKRQREQKKREKRLAKQEKMALRRAQKADGATGPQLHQPTLADDSSEGSESPLHGAERLVQGSR